MRFNSLKSNLTLKSAGLGSLVREQRERERKEETEEKRCQDHYSFCSHWEAKGYCQNGNKFEKWMGKNCPVACGLCQENSLESAPTVNRSVKFSDDEDGEHSMEREATCKDKYPISCPKWKKMNRCDHSDVFLRDYIRKNCNLSCGLCATK